MEDLKELKDLEYLAIKSKELIEKQINSYRHRHTNSGTLITVLALFIPLFIGGLDDSYIIIKILALLPITSLILAIICLIQVLNTKPLHQGLNFKLIDVLINDTYENILLHEIGANKDSFDYNEQITTIANNKYNLAIKLTFATIIMSSLLLLGNQSFKPEKDSIKVTIVKSKNMSDDNKKKEEKPVVRTIPKVDPQFRVILNKGGKPKSSDKKSGDKK